MRILEAKSHERRVTVAQLVREALAAETVSGQATRGR
jgi:hypothetical protein